MIFYRPRISQVHRLLPFIGSYGTWIRRLLLEEASNPPTSSLTFNHFTSQSFIMRSDSHHSLTLGDQDLRPRSGESDKIPTPPTGCLRGKPHRLPASSQQDCQSSKELLKLPDWLPAQQGAAESWKRKRMNHFPRALQRPHLPRKRKEMNLFPESISIGRFSFKE